MSRQLTLSATFSVLAMTLFALLGDTPVHDAGAYAILPGGVEAAWEAPATVPTLPFTLD